MDTNDTNKEERRRNLDNAAKAALFTLASDEKERFRSTLTAAGLGESLRARYGWNPVTLTPEQAYEIASLLAWVGVPLPDESPATDATEDGRGPLDRYRAATVADRHPDLAGTVADLIDEHGSLPLLQALQAEFQRRADLLSTAWQPLADDLAGVCEREQARRETK